MEEKKYLDEEQYQRNAKKVKKIGFILLIIGIIITLGSIVSLVLGFRSFGNIDTDNIFSGAGFMFGGIFGLFIGSSFNMIGFVMLFMGYRREINAFTTQQSMPVVKETVNDITPTVSNAAGSIAKEVSKGIKEGLKEDE